MQLDITSRRVGSSKNAIREDHTRLKSPPNAGGSNKSLPTHPPAHPKDMRRLNLRIEFDIVRASLPNIAGISKEVVNLIAVTLNAAKIFRCDIDLGMVFSV